MKPAMPEDTRRAAFRLRRWFCAAATAAAACLALCAAAAAAELPDVLRAAAARRDITPAKPVTLAGYASRKDLSQGVHDPLYARVVALEHGSRRLVLVSTDLIGFYDGTAESTRKAILAACRLKPSELFLTAIHTHSGPGLTLNSEKGHPNNVEYTRTLQGQLVDAVREALAALAPVEIAVGSGSSPVGVNRREPTRDASGNTRIVLGRNPDVLTDREVQVMRVVRAGTTDLLAVLFAYATHSTAMGPKNYLIGGDVHGLAEQFLERRLGAGVVAAAFAGASGDIDPWYRVLPKFDTDGGWIPEAVLMGTMLGQEVVHVLNKMQKPEGGGPVATAFKTLMLPGKPRDRTGEATRPAESPAPPGDAPAAAGEAPVEFNVTVGRIGRTAFVGLGGEVFNDIGKAIKAASPFPHTFIITHCNGAAGYLPTRESYPAGGYEVQSSRFAPGAAEQVVSEVLRMLRDLRNDSP